MSRTLPIDSHLEKLTSTAISATQLIITAAPGTGKTTRFPVALMKKLGGQVWVLEPRRIAAVSAAARIADENEWNLGEEVGYQVRFDNESSSSTKLLFMTEALLIKKLRENPELKGVSAIVLDEFHERSLHVDLALGAIAELKALARPDLVLVVMSATLDAQALSEWLNDAPIHHVEGQNFSLEIVLDQKSQLLRTTPEWYERMVGLIRRAISENQNGDLLVFVPGKGEIEKLSRELHTKDWAKDFSIRALHGSLSLSEQRLALDPGGPNRKIVLSTNVAESSLTVEGVRIVVDSGLVRIQELHPRTGYESLTLSRISKSSATQRAGRAARLGPGKAYQAWSNMDELSMKAHERAEVFRVDLSEALLCLAGLGVSNFREFLWFETPPLERLQQGVEFLQDLKALDENCRLTDLGAELTVIPLPLRMAKLVYLGAQTSFSDSFCRLATLLSERDSLGGIDSQSESDLLPSLERWLQRSHPRSEQLNRVLHQIKKINSDLQRKKLTANLELQSHRSEETLIHWVLLDCYQDRLCRRRKPLELTAKMVHGRGVRLQEKSNVQNSEYFLALELGEQPGQTETKVFQAHGLPAEIVLKWTSARTKVQKILEYDKDSKSFLSTEEKQFLGLAIGPVKKMKATPTQIEDQLATVALSSWSEISQRNPHIQDWLNRWQAFENYLLNQKKELPPSLEISKALEMACLGLSSLNPLFEIDWSPQLEMIVDEKFRTRFHKECPQTWTAPSGRNLPIRYSVEQGASVECRLQEVFGTLASPQILGQSLTFILTAPNDRPVQVTRNLETFWSNAYTEVRKELRTRYPKHSWPEDPRTAVPQLKGRPRSR